MFNGLDGRDASSEEGIRMLLAAGWCRNGPLWMDYLEPQVTSLIRAYEIQMERNKEKTDGIHTV